MDAIRRHPGYTSWVVFLAIVLVVAALSPAGVLAIPIAAVPVALVVSFAAYLFLKRAAP